MNPEVRYVERDGKFLAYEIFGTGPVDLVVFQSCCPIDLLWDLPQLAMFMKKLGESARVIVYDPRGQGASDHIVDPGVAAFEAGNDDALAVLDAVRAEQATYFDMGRGATGVALAAIVRQTKSGGNRSIPTRRSLRRERTVTNDFPGRQTGSACRSRS